MDVAPGDSIPLIGARKCKIQILSLLWIVQIGKASATLLYAV